MSDYNGLEDLKIIPPEIGSAYFNKNSDKCIITDIKGKTLIFIYNLSLKKYEFCFLRFFYSNYRME
jgi:hypothetical protein